MTSQAAIVYRIISASTVVWKACFCKQQRWVLDSNRRVGVWSFPWRWHIRSILSMTGRGISAETCGLDDVFPPDDLCSRPGTLSHYIFIYTYAFLIRVLVIVRRAGLLWSQQDFEWRWSVPLFKCLTVLEFSFILFDLCLLITFFNFIMNYVPIVTFWIFTYHKIWILSIMFCFIWSYWIIIF